MTPLWVADWADRAWHPSSRGARLAHGVLKSLGALHGQVVRWRNRAYDRGRLRVERVPAHVIGVGNLTVGGSGKTPTVLWLAIALQDRGRRVAIVARGYGKQRRGVVVVSRGAGPEVSARDGGDEAVMLAHRFSGPIVTGEDRVAAAQVAITQFGVDTLILDDGFQHRALGRDADLLLLPPGGTPAGLLPAGAFREPWTSMQRATALLAIDAVDYPPVPFDQPVFAATVVPQCLVTWAGGVLREEPLTLLAGRRVTVVAGIARPERVAAALTALGAIVVDTMRFPDHHDYTPVDRARLGQAARTTLVICTEKDLVKLPPGPADVPPYALRISLEVPDGGRLVDRLVGGFRRE